MEPLLGPAEPAADLITTATEQDFMAKVVEASAKMPIIVAFLSERSEPSLQIMPALEKQITEAGGRIKLVLVNADENQNICSQLRVQTLPTVMAFKDGRPVDAFAGAASAVQIKQFIEKLTGDLGPSPTDQMLEMGAKALAENNFEAALQAYGQIAHADPNNLEAMGGLLRAYVMGDHLDEAKQLIQTIPEKNKNNPAIKGAIAALEMAEMTADSGDVAELKKALKKDKDNHEVRLQLSTALQAAGQTEEAANELLTIIGKDNEWNEKAANKQLLSLFDFLGPMDPLTIKLRRQLSSLLFS